MKIKLPIDEHLEKICSEIKKNKLFILKSSPGSGKTTRLPPKLLDVFPGKILVLEPRRLAAKFSAKRIADELQTEVGKEVGHAFRFERKISNETRLIFFTEGTFLRYLAKNPDLKGVDAVILDEFHERHKETDLAWTLLRKIQTESRKDLHLVVMSATLDKKLFPSSASFFEIETPLFPIMIHYSERSSRTTEVTLEKKVGQAFWKALDFEGDILVFLPGMRDILKTEELLQPLAIENQCEICLLHGDLSNEEQARVMNPIEKRKVILSTNIAESSLTIPGVRIVIDTGLFRQSTFSPWTGLSHLETKKHSKSSAIQRAGRAGRTGSGEVFRLFSKEEFEERVEFDKPEIMRSDLSESLLLLASFKLSDFFALPWIELPTSSSIEMSLAFLEKLGALSKGKITSLGLQMADCPLHPRLSRILIEALNWGEKKTKEMILFISSLEENSFLRKKLENQLFSLVRDRIRNLGQKISFEQILLHGFIDRLGTLIEGKDDSLLLCNGEMIKISYELRQELNREERLQLLIDVSPSGEARRLIPIKEDWLYEMEPFPIEERRNILWDERKNEIVLNEELRVGKILLSETKKKIHDLALSESEKNEVQKVVREKLTQYIKDLKNSEVFQRYFFLKIIFPESWSDNKDNEFIQLKAQEFTSLNEDDQIALSFEYKKFLLETFDPENTLSIDTFLPEKLVLADRRSLTIHYDQEPWVAAYIQDFYGLSDPPRIAGGRFPLTLQLLGPHKRALQITKDLKSFWKNTYPLLYKELSRDYPRHYWPLEPASAKPYLLKKHLPS